MFHALQTQSVPCAHFRDMGNKKFNLFVIPICGDGSLNKLQSFKFQENYVEVLWKDGT